MLKLYIGTTRHAEFLTLTPGGGIAGAEDPSLDLYRSVQTHATILSVSGGPLIIFGGFRSWKI